MTSMKRIISQTKAFDARGRSRSRPCGSARSAATLPRKVRMPGVDRDAARRAARPRCCPGSRRSSGRRCLRRAAPDRASASFSTGMDSPVSADWVTKKSLAARMRRSAGMIEPAARTTMSPGTISAIGTSASVPSRSDDGARLDHELELLGGVARAALLEVGEEDADEDHADDDRAGAQVAHREGDDADDEELDGQGILEAAEHLGDEALALLAREDVGSVFAEAYRPPRPGSGPRASSRGGRRPPRARRRRLPVVSSRSRGRTWEPARNRASWRPRGAYSGGIATFSTSVPTIQRMRPGRKDPARD